jgi:hypothetical protein
MKHPLLLLLLLVCGSIHSQYCGNSGPQVCTPQYYVADTIEWLSRPFDSLPCIAQNMPYNESVTLRCDSLPAVAGGQLFFLSGLFEIDSIVGLPNGICWATNDSDNMVNRDWICINFSGVCQAPRGDYPAVVVAYLYFPGLAVQGGREPFRFTLRVREASDPCVSIASRVPVVESSASYHAVFNESGFTVTTTTDFAQVTITDLAGQLLEQRTIAPAETASIFTNNYRGMLLVTIAEKSGIKTYKLFR